MDIKVSRWIDLVGVYIKEGATSLVVYCNRKISTEDLKQLITYIPGSQLKKIDFWAETSEQDWEPFFESLKASNIQELRLNGCCKTKEEYLNLMEHVKKTRITKYELRLDRSDEADIAAFDLDELNKFISCLVDSNLKIFDFDLSLFNELSLVALYNALPRTKISQLKISGGENQCLTPVTFSALCRNLEFTQIIDLSLVDMGLNIDSVKLISSALKNSSVQKLDLRGNSIGDNGVDILVDGLVRSKINNLALSFNKINGANVLGIRLKDTQIKTLSLSVNTLKQYGMFLMPLKLSSVVSLDVHGCGLTIEHFRKLMNSLKFSKVTELNVSRNKFKLNAGASNIFKHTNLTRVDFSKNDFDQEALICLAGSIKDSKLNHINLSKCFHCSRERMELSRFLSEVRTSTINSLDLSRNQLVGVDVELIALHLADSEVTHLDLSGNKIKNGVRSLAKLTKLSCLRLSFCDVEDECVEGLALIFKNTQLIKLILNANKITSLGAMNLAPHLKDSCLLQLYLYGNKIESDGVDALVQGMENTFITSPVVHGNCGVFDLVLWRNKIAKQRLLNLFKLISPKFGSNFFRFVHPDVMHTSEFLESCLELCVTVTQKPSAISVLLEDESIQFSRKEIIALISDEFPSQFVLFVARSVEADAETCVSLLKKAEDWKLSKVVEMFLLNRPLFTIDVNEGILHPYAYKLLHQYNHPICNLEIEPEGVEKILKYFIEHIEVEGASDVVKLLC